MRLVVFEMSTRDVYERQFDESCGKSCGNASCPECGGQVITDAGERRCQSCGLIIDGHGIDHGPEWRSFEREERKRVGAPRTPTRHDHGLATEIGRHVDANGTPIPGERRQQLSRLRTQHSRSRYQSSRERRLAHGLDEVRRLAGVLDLPDSLRDQACRCFRSAQQADLLPGRSIEAVATASVHAACRCAGLSRTLAELVPLARVAESRVRSAYNALNIELGLPAKPVTPVEFVPRVSDALDVTDQIRRRARSLAEASSDEWAHSGANPHAVAAACVYTAAAEQDWPLTQARAAAVSDTSVKTVRTHHQTLCGVDV